MRFRVRILALGLASLVLAGCDGVVLGDDWNRYKEDFHYTYPLSANGRIEVENFNGPVEITGWDQNNVDITGTKSANSEERLKEIKIDVSATAGSVTIRTVRPLDHFGGGGVRYVIRAPRRANLDRIVSSNGPVWLEMMDSGANVRTSNGPVHATHVHGALGIETSNGPVDVTELEGSATVHTSNGPIRLSMDSAGEVRASTSNGPITIHVPPGIGADVRARTSHGPISTDFDVTSRGFFSKNHLEGAIGKGGPLMDLSTSNGPIRIVKF